MSELAPIYAVSPRNCATMNSVTVCIAAIPYFNTQSVLAVSDTMIANELHSIETREFPKIWSPGFPSDWLMMYSGDPGTAHLVIHDIHDQLCGDSSGSRRPALLSKHELMDLVTAVFRRTIKRQIEDAVLAPYDLDMTSFLALGIDRFGEREFSRLCAAIESIQLALELLIVGSDRHNLRALFSVDQRGVCTDWTSVGFHAIGAGASIALSSLHARGPTDNLGLSETAYRLLEAKFFAENARSVGRETTLIALRSSHVPQEGANRIRICESATIDAIRAIWEAERLRPLPSQALELLRRDAF